MPSPGIMLVVAAVAGVMWVGDKVIHLKPIQKTNHVICRIVTVGEKCKTKK